MIRCTEGQSKGGRINAERRRSEAYRRYYENPNLCHECETVIKIKDNEKAAEARRRSFCSLSCSAKYNNTGRERYVGGKKSKCCHCGVEISLHYSKRGHRYVERKYCRGCFKRKLHISRVDDRAKGDLFASYANWQSARSAIRKCAFRSFEMSGKPKVCDACGYSTHVDICHLIPVSDFPDETLIREINHIDNLVALCKNHHWELDNGILKIDNPKRGERNG